MFSTFHHTIICLLQLAIYYCLYWHREIRRGNKPVICGAGEVGEAGFCELVALPGTGLGNRLGRVALNEIKVWGWLVNSCAAGTGGHLQPSSLSHWCRFLGELSVRQCLLLWKHPGDPKSPECNKSPKLPSLKGFKKEATEVAIVSSSRSIAFLSSLGILSPCQGLFMVGVLSSDLLSHPHLATCLQCFQLCWRRSKR